jgi:hypothetical protein
MENERIKTKLAGTDAIRISQATIQRSKDTGGNYPVSWDIVINRILHTYEEKEERREW